MFINHYHTDEIRQYTDMAPKAASKRWACMDDVMIWEEVFDGRSAQKIAKLGGALARSDSEVKDRIRHLLDPNHAAAQRLREVLALKEQGEVAANTVIVDDKATLNEMQGQAFRAALRGKNIFVTGGAGTGKSFVLRYIISHLAGVHEMVLPPGAGGLAVLAPTGIAADHIGGETVHSFGSIFPGVDRPPGPEAQARYVAAQTLILDEVSMLDFELLEHLDRDAKLSRGNDEPFGGLQVILCGDFFQLPPVGGRYAFESDVWGQLGIEMFDLVEVIRQASPGLHPHASASS